MNLKRGAVFRLGMLALLTHPVAFGQTAGIPRTGAPATIPSTAPTITILPATTGALVRSQGAGNAALDLGKVSYFKGTSAPGQSIQKNPSAFVISTRFAIKVDCPGSSSSSRVNVSVSRADASASHSMAVDGTALGTAPQLLVQSMRCGSSGEHRLDVEVPISTPAGPIGSTIAFLAALAQ
jgi:hypothetical protein